MSKEIEIVEYCDDCGSPIEEGQEVLNVERGMLFCSEECEQDYLNHIWEQEAYEPWTYECDYPD